MTIFAISVDSSSSSVLTAYAAGFAVGERSLDLYRSCFLCVFCPPRGILNELSQWKPVAWAGSWAVDDDMGLLSTRECTGKLNGYVRCLVKERNEKLHAQ